MNAPPTAPPPPPPPTPPPALHRRLHRDRANGILGGVAAGIAATYDLDVTIVRVVWVVAAILWIGVPAYIVAWIAITPADGPMAPAARKRDAGMLAGLTLVGIGALIASDRILPHGFRFNHFGAPVLLIAGGAAILLLRRPDHDRPDPPQPDLGVAFPPPAPPAASRTGATGTSTNDTSTNDTSTNDTSTNDTSTNDTSTNDTATSDAVTQTVPTVPTVPAVPLVPPLAPPSAWTQTTAWPTPPSARALRRASRHERRAQRPRSFITPITLSILLIGAGIASLIQATGAADVNLTVVLAIGTCVVGAALVTAAFVGRAHLLIPIGILLLIATATSNTIDVPMSGGIGNREYRPLQISDVQHNYELGIGQLDIDLRDVSLANRTTTVDARTGLGELLVFVPSSVRVVVNAHAGAGATMLFGQQSGGVPADNERVIAGTGPGELILNLRVGAGQVRVRRFEPGGIETILGGN